MTLRKILFWGHLITGCVVGLLIANMAISGMVLAFAPQIVDWSERGSSEIHGPLLARAPLPAESLLAIAEKVKPNVFITGLTFRSSPVASWFINFSQEERGLYLDPYTGEVLGFGSKARTLLLKVEDWHQRFSQKNWGVRVTGVISAGFLMMLLSGLCLWVPREFCSAAFAGRLYFQKGLKGKARDWNWHNTIGFWSSPFILITVVTGLVMSYLPSRQNKKVPDQRAPAMAIYPTIYIALAKSKMADWEEINLRFPKKNGDPVTAFIKTNKKQWGPPNRARLKINAFSGEEISWEPAGGGNMNQRWRAWVTPLHTGRAWGGWGQLIMFFSAVGSLILVYTGLRMAWRRINYLPDQSS